MTAVAPTVQGTMSRLRAGAGAEGGVVGEVEEEEAEREEAAFPAGTVSSSGTPQKEMSKASGRTSRFLRIRTRETTRWKRCKRLKGVKWRLKQSN